MKTRRVIRGALLGLVILLALAQLIRPDLSNPPAPDSSDMLVMLSAPPEVATVLQRSCYDCHSHHTRWPWYAHVAPASWLVAHDVEEARSHVNFSRWGDYTEDAARHKLQEAQEEVHGGDMPLWYYLLLHPRARLSESDRAEFANWVNGMQANKK